MPKTFSIPAGATKVTIPDAIVTQGDPTFDATIPPPVNQPPISNAGTAQVLTLPNNAVTLNGQSSDSDGTIVNNKWSQLSGPNTATIASPNTLSTAVSGLVAGIYVFKLTSTDNIGASTSSSVTITVNPAVVVTPPAGNWVIKYQNGFETKADLDPFNNGQITNGTIVPAPGRTGNCFKAWVKTTQPNTHSGWRDEWQGPDSLLPNGIDIIKKYKMMIQAMDSNTTGLIEQDHGEVDGTSGERSLWADGGFIRAQRNVGGAAGSPNIFGPGKKAISGLLNQWLDVEIHVKYSTGNDGYCTIYIGDLVTPFYDSGLTKTTDGHGQYPKLGINWFNGAPKSDVIVLYDDFSISHKQ